MFLRIVLCALLLVFIVLKEVTAQVCNETKSVLREFPETYKYTYYEAYEGNDCLIWCTKSKLAVNIGIRYVEKLVNETVNVCCEGYTADDSYVGNGTKCVPICHPPCDNGFCRNPNECVCGPGYAIDHNDALKRCVPLCLEGCDTPNCLSTCSQISSDYNYDTLETDMCDGTCLNGTCVAPGICHCQLGYERILDNCEPICTSCDHGSCIAPGICKCDFGWRDECGSCRPVCSGCEHGKCKAPGQCECNPGYKALNAKCEPYCQGCSNGNCVGPDLCACDPGWYFNKESEECDAHCDVACGNGTCVAPNFCACYYGYRVKTLQEGDERFNEAPQCVPDCKNCDGICVAPNVCKCEAGYEAIYTTIDGKECDCFDCADASKKCDRITCRKNTNVENDMVDINESKTFAAPHNVEETFSNLGNATLNTLTKSMNTSCSTEKPIESTYHWIYIAIIIIELLVIVCMIMIMQRKHIMNRLKTKKFVPQDKPKAEVAVHYTSSVTCSKLKENTEYERN